MNTGWKEWHESRKKYPLASCLLRDGNKVIRHINVYDLDSDIVYYRIIKED